MLRMPGKSFEGVAPEFTTDQLQLQSRLKTHIDVLAGQIGERNMRVFAALEKAKHYILDELNKIGGQVRMDSYTLDGKEVRFI